MALIKHKSSARHRSVLKRNESKSPNKNFPKKRSLNHYPMQIQNNLTFFTFPSQ